MRSLVVAMMIAGCGGGGIDAKDYIDAELAASCDREVRCGLFTDTASCLALLGNYNDVTFLDEVNMGLINYEPDKAEECVNDIRNAPCDESSMDARVRPGACTAVISGTGLTGDSCISNEQCQSAACSKTTGSQTCDMGTCVPTTEPGKLGEPCASRDCEAGLVCDNTKTCAMLYTEGMACANSSECNYELLCDNFPTGFCRHAPKIGEPCPAHQCAEVGAYCDADGICSAVGLTGDACSPTLECSLFYPCNTMLGTCQPYPVTGQPCTSLCSDGSFCESTSMICTAPGGNGAPCTADDQCLSSKCDSTTTHTCIDQTSCF